MIDQQWSALFLRAFLCLYDCVKVKLQLQYCTVILQTNVWRVSFFVLQEFLIYLTSRLFLLLCSPRLIFFSAFLYSGQDLSHKIGKSWTLLIGFLYLQLLRCMVLMESVRGLLFGCSQFSSSQSLIHFYLPKY